MEQASIWSNWIQLGFAGFSLILLGIVVWLASKLIGVLKDSTTVVSNNTNAILTVTTGVVEAKAIMIEVKDSLQSRPCQLPEDVQEVVHKLLRNREQSHKLEVAQAAKTEVRADMESK